MSDAASIVAALRASGVTMVASLPDQWLTGVLEAVDAADDLRHVRVNREDEGVGICAGAALAGVRAVLICQNAGLLLSGNMLAGLAHHHELPVVALAAHRGRDDDPYPYQRYKGRVTAPVLEALGVPHRVVDDVDDAVVAEAFSQAEAEGTPVVLLLSVSAFGLDPQGAW